MKIRVKSLSLDSYGYATEIDDARRLLVEFDNGPTYWMPEADLQQVIYLPNPKPAHFFLEDGSDLGQGWVEKLEDGSLQVRVTFAGEDKIIAIGGGVGLTGRGHNEPFTYTIVGVMFGIHKNQED